MCGPVAVRFEPGVCATDTKETPAIVMPLGGEKPCWREGTPAALHTIYETGYDKLDAMGLMILPAVTDDMNDEGSVQPRALDPCLGSVPDAYFFAELTLALGATEADHWHASNSAACTCACAGDTISSRSHLLSGSPSHSLKHSSSLASDPEEHHGKASCTGDLDAEAACTSKPASIDRTTSAAAMLARRGSYDELRVLLGSSAHLLFTNAAHVVFDWDAPCA